MHREESRQRGSVENQLTSAVRGVLGGITPQGEPLVDFCGNSTGQQLVAVTTVTVRPEDVGKEAILLFEDGDVTRPILVGLVQPPSASRPKSDRMLDITLDGQQITLTGEQEICLRCGEASITLTRAGKVLIKGTYLLSKSTGPNRIKGGSIQLN